MLYSRSQDDPSHLTQHRVPATGSLFFGEYDEDGAKSLGIHLNRPAGSGAGPSGHYDFAQDLSYTWGLGDRMSDPIHVGRLFGQPAVTNQQISHSSSSSTPVYMSSGPPSAYSRSSAGLTIDTAASGPTTRRSGGFYPGPGTAAEDGSSTIDSKSPLGMGLGIIINGSSASSSSGIHHHHHHHQRSHSGDFESSSITVGDRDDSSTASPTTAGTEPRRKKQKRNKPTLSCFECVERKTKCDRGRPHCLACIKRQTECKYAHVANLLEETSRNASNGRRMTKPPKKKPGTVKASTPNAADRGFTTGRINALGSVATSTGLFSNVPYSAGGSSNVFGIGSEHPFANYWTCDGGLPEVISVLPDKLQADILLNRYFECVDPVYPMLHRQTFYADYEHFWSLPIPERNRQDAAFIALIFVMLALGTQFVTTTSPREKKQSAEFYASASNQALRVGSYLSIASSRSIQAMVLITYFLINDNHASDGWAFAGILMRQAYAMGLHRDPNIVCPDASPFDKQQRRKLWQAVLLQDTFLTVLLSLPPNATHTDVNVEDLIDDGSSIASDDPTDTAYIRGSWSLANLVQETICSPRSLDLPICTTARHRSKLIADFRSVYRSFPDIFRSWDPDALAQMAQEKKRIVRQTLFLSSNYFHNLMLVHGSESPEVPVNVRGTLEAAHDAITSFFVLFSLFESEARVWWVFNHRAFLEALCIGNVLRETAREPGGEESLSKDPLFVRARADIHRMIEIMQLMSEGEQASETARTRIQVLSEFL